MLSLTHVIFDNVIAAWYNSQSSGDMFSMTQVIPTCNHWQNSDDISSLIKTSRLVIIDTCHYWQSSSDMWSLTHVSIDKVEATRDHWKSSRNISSFTSSPNMSSLTKYLKCAY